VDSFKETKANFLFGIAQILLACSERLAAAVTNSLKTSLQLKL